MKNGMRSNQKNNFLQNGRMKVINKHVTNPIKQKSHLFHKNPKLYEEEFLQQYNQFIILYNALKLNPHAEHKEFANSIVSLSKVNAHYNCKVVPYYKDKQEEFKMVCIDSLKITSHPEMKLILCKITMGLRQRKIIDTMTFAQLMLDCILSLHQTSFDQSSNDIKLQSSESNNSITPSTSLYKNEYKKKMRNLIISFLVNDMKNENSRHKNPNLNSKLQTFLYQIYSANTYDSSNNTNNNNNNFRIDDDFKAFAKTALLITMRLYIKGIWNDGKTVNFLAQACFSRIANIMSMAIRFFLNPNDFKVDEDNDPSCSATKSNDGTLNAADIMKRSKITKKTRSRKKQTARQLKALVKRTTATVDKEGITMFNSNTQKLIDYLYDSQEFAEKLFLQLQHRNEGFEIRSISIDLVSRIIGLHKLQIPNFYPYIQRYLQPHQSNVTKLLLYTVQATHEMVPPETLKPIVMCIANNFITEKNSGEVITVGLNAIRELCNRNALVMDKDLLNDLEMYKTYKNKNVVMASRSLINLFRTANPGMLLKADRGRVNRDWKNVQPAPYGTANTVNEDPLEGFTQLASERMLTQDELDRITHLRKKQNSNNTNNSSKENNQDSNRVEKNTDQNFEIESEDESDTDPMNETMIDDNQSEDDNNSDINNCDNSSSCFSEDLCSENSSIDYSEKDHNNEINSCNDRSEQQFKLTLINSNAENVSLSSDTSESNSDSDDEENNGGLPTLGDIERIYKVPKMTKEARIQALKDSRHEDRFIKRRQMDQKRRKDRKKGSNNNSLANLQSINSMSSVITGQPNSIKKQNPSSAGGGRAITNRDKAKRKPFMMIRSKLMRRKKQKKRTAGSGNNRGGRKRNQGKHNKKPARKAFRA